MGDWSMELILKSRWGDEYRMCKSIDSNTAREVTDIKPPSELCPYTSSFQESVNMIKRREFRKDLFINAARNLGELLAQRMSDAEGWHDKTRVEPAKLELKGIEGNDA